MWQAQRKKREREERRKRRPLTAKSWAWDEESHDCHLKTHLKVMSYERWGAIVSTRLFYEITNRPIGSVFFTLITKFRRMNYGNF